MESRTATEAVRRRKEERKYPMNENDVWAVFGGEGRRALTGARGGGKPEMASPRAARPEVPVESGAICHLVFHLSLCLLQRSLEVKDGGRESNSSF